MPQKGVQNTQKTSKNLPKNDLKSLKIYIYIVLNGLLWYLKKKIAAVIFCVDGWQNRLNLGTFNFKARFSQNAHKSYQLKIGESY